VRVLVQRVRRAQVVVASECVGKIGQGLLLLVGAAPEDTEDDIDYLAEKITNLRIFADDEGKMNRSALDDSYEMLVVSQFTLHANVRKGRRPSFIGAAPPEVAAPLVDALVDHLRVRGLHVETGVFGAEMDVSLVNEGPVTIWLDTDDLRG
jgi:D-aminoacyl-tRNA deacylase